MPIFDPVHSIILNFRKRCKEKWNIPDDNDICFCRSAKRGADFCSCEIDTDYADCRYLSSLVIFLT